jgi:predicted MFS family arabinose efflux permease
MEMQPNPAKVRNPWLVVAVLAAGMFSAFVNLSVLSPLLPSIADEFGVSESTAGQLTTAGALVFMMTALVAAPLLPRIGPVRWLRGSALLFGTGIVVAALAPSFGTLAIGRMLSATAVLMPASLLIASSLFHDDHRRNQAFGIIISATTIALMAGLPVVTVLEDAAGWRWAISSLLIPIALFFAGTWLLPATRPARADEPFKSGALSVYRQVLEHDKTRWLLITQVLFALLYVGWLTYYGAYAEEELGADAGTISLLFLAAGIAELLFNNVTPYLLRRMTSFQLFATGSIAFAAALLSTGLLVTNTAGAFVAIVLISGAASVNFMVLSILLIDSQRELRGPVMSLNSAAIGIGAALGAAIAGASLAVLDDYEAVYRLLGVIPLLSLVTLAVAIARGPQLEVQGSEVSA